MLKVLLIVLAVSQIAAAPVPAAVGDFEDVSLIALIANPEAYDGKRVRTDGYLTLIFEDNGLHLDRNAYRAGLRRNAVSVEPPRTWDKQARRRLSGRYAFVEGRFDASSHGHGGLYSGRLTDIRRIEPTYTQADHQWYTFGLYARWWGPRLLAAAALVLGAVFLFLRLRRRKI